MADTAEIDVVKKIFAAINDNDIPAIMKSFDPEIERIEFEGTASGGVFKGLEKIRKHFSEARATWEEGSCTPEKFISHENKVIALVHVRVRVKNRSEWAEGHIADVFTFRNGKVIEMRSFMTAQEAFKWAGVQSGLS